MRALFCERRALIAPFVVEHISPLEFHAPHDVEIEARWGNLWLRFLAQIMPRASVRGVREMVLKMRGRGLASPSSSSSVLPLLVAPYLSGEVLDLLEADMISGVDLSGNGVIVAADRFLVRRGGAPNRFPVRSPLRDPFRGQAATVVRWIIERRHFHNLSDLHHSIREGFASVSLSQCSKTVATLHEDGFISKDDGTISVGNIGRLVERLRQAWQGLRFDPPVAVRVPGDPLRHLARHLRERTWVVSGASSAARYTNLAQAGPIRVLVDHVGEAMHRLEAQPEDVPAFASLLLQRCDEPSAYCGTVVEDGVRWASRLQTWLELSTGDARQAEAAAEIYRPQWNHA